MDYALLKAIIESLQATMQRLADTLGTSGQDLRDQAERLEDAWATWVVG